MGNLRRDPAHSGYEVRALTSAISDQHSCYFSDDTVGAVAVFTINFYVLPMTGMLYAASKSHS